MHALSEWKAESDTFIIRKDLCHGEFLRVFRKKPEVPEPEMAYFASYVGPPGVLFKVVTWITVTEVIELMELYFNIADTVWEDPVFVPPN